MTENDGTDAPHPRRAVAWGCAGGLSAVPLLSTVFSTIITPQTDNHYPLRISKGLNPLRIQAI
jgi:hypothetical protein